MISVPRPLTTNDIASVAISALMRRRVTTRPLTSPTASPTATPRTMATTGDVCCATSARGHAGEGVDRADGEVDAAGHENERPGRGDDQDRRLLIEDVQQVDLRQERRAGDRERDEERREGQRDAGRPQALGARLPERPAPDAPPASVTPSAPVTPRSGRGCRERGRQHRRLGHLLAAQLADDPARAHHEHAVGEPEDLLELGGDEQHAEAVVGQRHEQVVDRPLGADVDPARGLVGDEHLRPAQQHAREEQLLLVAARQRARRRAGAVRPHRPALERLAGAPALGAAADEAVAADAAQAGQGDVLRDRAPEQQPVLLARLGDHRHARAQPRPRAARQLVAAGHLAPSPRSGARRRRSRAPARCARRRRARRGPRSRRRGR